MRQRLLWLDVLKGWGICFIVLGHIFGAGVHLSTGDTQKVCALAYKYFYAFHVPLFFFVAGITFRRCDWQDFLRRKAQRLLLPYFIIGFVSLIVYWGLHDVGKMILQLNDTTGFYTQKATYASIGGYILTLVSGFSYGPMFAPNSVLWFIPALFSLEVIAQLFVRKELNWKSWVLIGGVMWGIAHLLPLPTLPWLLNKVPYYFPFFALGVLWGRYGWVIPQKSVGRGILLIVLFGVLAIWNPYQYYGRTLGQQVITWLITCGNIFGWLWLTTAWAWRPMAFLGVCSLGIMVLHKFPMLLLQNAIPCVRAFFQGDLLDLSLGIVVVFIGALVVSLTVYLVCLRYLPFVFGYVPWPTDFINWKGKERSF